MKKQHHKSTNMVHVEMGRKAAQLIPRLGVQIYSLGVGPPPHTGPNNPIHTQPMDPYLLQITL
jgi:hypothetical protein